MSSEDYLKEVYPVGTRVKVNTYGIFYDPKLHGQCGEVIELYGNKERLVLLDRDKGKTNDDQSQAYYIGIFQLKSEKEELIKKDLLTILYEMSKDPPESFIQEILNRLTINAEIEDVTEILKQIAIDIKNI